MTGQSKNWSGHSQTILGHFAKSKKFKYESEFVRLKLSNGTNDFCGLHISVPKHHSPPGGECNPVRKKIVLLLFHGLGGTSDSDYICRTADLAFEMGWTVIRVDHRGSGHVAGEFTQPYHSGRGEDVSDILDFSKSRFPGCEQVVFGVSMSGTIILNLLTGRFGKTLPDKAIIVNAPLNLHDASARLKTGFSLFYDWRFYFKLKKMILQKEKNFFLPKIGNTQTIDELFTSVKSGFKNRVHYYDECSPFNHVNQIKTETFILTAEDDPIVSYDLYKQAQWSKPCRLYFSTAGGHVGYYSGSNIKYKNKDFGRRWLDYFLYSVFEVISSDNSKQNEYKI